MYTLINGSPKPKDSNSLYFLKLVSSNLDNYNLYELRRDKYNDIIDSINLSDVIILSFPLYVDSPTSITLSFLDYFIDNQIDLKDKNIYIIINCGFREGQQNITAVNIIKRWCDKVGGNYGGSIMIGAGEIVGNNRFKFISRKALKKVKKFSSFIREKQTSDDIITTMDLFNNKMFCLVANAFWNKKAKKNNLSSSNVRIK